MIIYHGQIGVVQRRDGEETEAIATIETVEPPQVFLTITVAEYLRDPLKISMSPGMPSSWSECWGVQRA
jgi:hypothetical protein